MPGSDLKFSDSAGHELDHRDILTRSKLSECPWSLKRVLTASDGIESRAKAMPSGFDYSKLLGAKVSPGISMNFSSRWNNIELSDDEEDAGSPSDEKSEIRETRCIRTSTKPHGRVPRKSGCQA